MSYDLSFGAVAKSPAWVTIGDSFIYGVPICLIICPLRFNQNARACSRRRPRTTHNVGSVQIVSNGANSRVDLAVRLRQKTGPTFNGETWVFINFPPQTAVSLRSEKRHLIVLCRSSTCTRLAETVIVVLTSTFPRMSHLRELEHGVSIHRCGVASFGFEGIQRRLQNR